MSDLEIEPYDVGCERCGWQFEFPTEGGQPTDGDFEGVPLCTDCFTEVEPEERQLSAGLD